MGVEGIVVVSMKGRYRIPRRFALFSYLVAQAWPSAIPVYDWWRFVLTLLVCAAQELGQIVGAAETILYKHLNTIQ